MLLLPVVLVNHHHILEARNLAHPLRSFEARSLAHPLLSLEGHSQMHSNIGHAHLLAVIVDLS